MIVQTTMCFQFERKTIRGQAPFPFLTCFIGSGVGDLGCFLCLDECSRFLIPFRLLRVWTSFQI